MIQSLYSDVLRLSGRYSVSMLCVTFGVSRSGYYKWLNRRGKLNRYEKTHEILDRCVMDIHAHHPLMGYRSVRDMLKNDFGWLVSDPTVWKSMKRLNIKGYVRQAKNTASTNGSEHEQYPNILRRDFRATAPLLKVATDITYIPYKGKWYYFAAFLDLFNNEVLEWELSDSFDIPLVLKPAQRLLERVSPSNGNLLIHSDQGTQYTSFGYRHLLAEHNVIQSMSRAGNPRDNAVMESFFGRFKDTLRRHFYFSSQDDLYDVVAKCVHYFNYTRPVRKLGGLPPVSFRLNLAA